MGYRKLAKIRKSMQIREPFVQKKFFCFLSIFLGKMTSPQPVKCSILNFWYYLTQPNVQVAKTIPLLLEMIVLPESVEIWIAGQFGLIDFDNRYVVPLRRSCKNAVQYIVVQWPKFLRYNMKCNRKHDTTWTIPRSVRFSPLHSMLYREKSISFGTVYNDKFFWR